MIDNFFKGSGGAGTSLLKSLLKNPLGIVVYSFFSKWYLLIALTGVVVTYWVYDGLKSAGVLDTAETIIKKALNESKSVAQNCVPKIANISVFWECVNNPPVYRPLTKEDLERIRHQALSPNLTDDSELDEMINPYQNSTGPNE